MISLLELYRETKIRLYGVYDDCDAEHHHVLREMEKVMNEPVVPIMDTPIHFCSECKYAVKRLGYPFDDWAKCTHPALPVNLVNGRRVFPCVIARGYQELCGPTGRWFTPPR